MKNAFLILFIFMILFQVSCFKQSENINRITNTSATQCTQTISSNTAVLLAKGLLYRDYNLKDYEIVITEKTDTWDVLFSKQVPGVGGSPQVSISKINGEVVNIINGK